VRLSSIRARVGLLSGLLVVGLVAGVTVTTYFVVATNMRHAAGSALERLVMSAEFVLARTVEETALAVQDQGLEGEQAETAIAETVTSAVPEPVARLLSNQGSFTLWTWREPGGGEPELAWSAGSETVSPSADLLKEAAALGEVTREVVDDRPLISGLLLSAGLGYEVAYVPVEVPGMDRAVVQVVYTPAEEERILDQTRRPMIVAALVSIVAALIAMNLTTGWTLSLVGNLTRTAEAIDVGQLDVQLPEQGDNEVAELARALNRLIVNLRRRNEAQARFIADASHELATPVAGIRGYVNILRAWGAEDPALREEAVSAIDRESRRMARLCSDLLSMIRNEEVVEYRQIRYDMNAIAREVLANAATRYMDKQFDFRGPEEGPLWLYGDPDRIEEALGILVDNACKYTPDKGRIAVTTRRHRDRVVVDVADTGVGIPSEDLASIFDRFYRSDVSRSKETGGFGLGLAIAKHIVDASGGSLTVRSIVGKGTTFEVTLPRQKAKMV
jgi:signal transduction histidine kinase